MEKRRPQIMKITNFEQLPLSEPIQRALAEKGYTKPTQIQGRAIPVLLKDRDLLACAQTGTGKTAAFALPLLHKLSLSNRKPFRRGVRHLVLTPTRELASQVAESFKVYGQYVEFKAGLVYGGVSEKPQIKQLFQGLDVLVACPGRLIDLMEQGHVDLSQVETFILDEADRMLDMGFIRDIRKIESKLPKERQTLLFSATMAPEITKLGQAMLHRPEEIRIAPQGTTAEKINQSVIFISKSAKQKYILELLKTHLDENPRELTLIFTRTKHGAKNLAKIFNKEGLVADSIHGNKSQNAREKTLDRYRKGEIDILVATDVAARGIDVKNITLVVNFDLPMESDSYVHRIGRTARAGESGQAISFCSLEEVALLRQVERLIKKPVPVLRDHSYHQQDIEDLHLSDRPVKKPAQGGGNRFGGGGRGNRQGGGGGNRQQRGKSSNNSGDNSRGNFRGKSGGNSGGQGNSRANSANKSNHTQRNRNR
jgi:ATP-dependent RNA helicase RhlE